MALTDAYSNLVALNQWLHMIPALIWIGLTLFLAFGFTPLLKQQDTATQTQWNRTLMPRFLGWMKIASALTLLLGGALFIQKYGWGNLWWDGEYLSDRALWMVIGMTLGGMMAVNLWLGIIPASGEGGEKRERAEFLSRVNAYLAGPTTVAMVAPNNYGAINMVTVAGAVVLGLGSVALLEWGAKKARAA